MPCHCRDTYNQLLNYNFIFPPQEVLQRQGMQNWILWSKLLAQTLGTNPWCTPLARPNFQIRLVYPPMNRCPIAQKATISNQNQFKEGKSGPLKNFKENLFSSLKWNQFKGKTSSVEKKHKHWLKPPPLFFYRQYLRAFLQTLKGQLFAMCWRMIGTRPVRHLYSLAIPAKQE